MGDGKYTQSIFFSNHLILVGSIIDMFFFSSREKDNFGVLCVDLIMVVIARMI